MKLTVNGKEVEARSGVSLAEFIAGKGMNPDTLVIEHNLAIVAKETWPDILLNPGDQVEIVKFVGGG